MNYIKNFMKKEIGIVLGVIFSLVFVAVSEILVPYFAGAYWYVVSSIQRLLFGVVELFVFIKIFKKENWTEVVHLKNFKTGFMAGFVMLIIILFDIITYFVIGAKSWVNTTIPIVVFCLFFQQITTGFWEELTFRAFVIEGYYKTEHRTKKTRFIYAVVSFVIFGMLHAIECDSLSLALYKFITSGIWGFAFASIYLHSHNILVVMFMHFITNVFSNATGFVAEWNVSTAFIILNDYIYFILLGVMFLVAVVYLCKEPKE